MPFKSEDQRKYLWARKPEVAREFADKEKKKGKKHRKEALKRRLNRGQS